jgi:hypothetical protein
LLRLFGVFVHACRSREMDATDVSAPATYPLVLRGITLDQGVSLRREEYAQAAGDQGFALQKTTPAAFLAWPCKKF